MKFFEELKERRIVRFAVSFIGIGWVALEVVDQLADRGILPEVLYNVVLIWFVVGIPAALLIGWHHGEKGRQKAPLSEVALLLMLAVMGAGWSVSTVTREREIQRLAQAPENPLEMRRIAIPYFFVESVDSSLQYIADGLTEDLITKLSQVEGLTVISRNGVLPLRGEDIPIDSIARLFGAGTIVHGTVERRRGRLRVDVGLYGSEGDRWKGVGLELGEEESLIARDSVASAIAGLLREWLGEEVRVRETATETRSTGAWSLLQQGEKVRKDAEAAFAAGDTDAAAALFSTADSLLARAEAMDPAWAEPPVSRAGLAYRQAYLAQRTPDVALQLIEKAVAHAEKALELSNTEARAYELRGTTNYYRRLLQLAEDAGEEDRLMESARADLERAVGFDRLLASAHATLSHLYYSEGDTNSGMLAAQMAYTTDMYLESAPLVLWRLFNGALEQGSFVTAREWCTEGTRRFPDDYRLASCDLRLMWTPHVADPDIAAAWAIVEKVDSLAPPARQEGQRVRNEMIMAGVIARAANRQSNEALRDSARSVLERATAAVTPQLDPTRETLPIAAYSWILIGEHERAVTVLQQHAAADPGFYDSTRGEATSWWWRPIDDHPKFRAITGAN